MIRSSVEEGFGVIGQKVLPRQMSQVLFDMSKLKVQGLKTASF
jgi:hypothetical protein